MFSRLKLLVSKPKPAALIVLSLTLAVYLNSFSNQFIGDDLDFITRWPQIQNTSHLKELFLGSLPPGHQGVYRPVRSLAYLISYQLFGVNPFGYHLFATLVHLSATYLVLLIVKKITKQPFIAFVTALLFGLHPIHTEAITFITSSFDSLGVVFMLLSFWFYLNPSTFKPKSPKPTPYLPIIFAIIAVFTYELTVILPLLILLYQVTFHHRSIATTIKSTSIYWFISAGFLIWRTQVLHIVGRGSYPGHSFSLTLLTSLKAIMKYFELLLWPTRLSLSHTLPGGISTYTYPEFNLEAITHQSAAEPIILLSLLVIIGLITTAIIIHRHYKIISFAIGWFLISLIPVLNLIPTGTILAEKYTYLASIGFCLLIALGIDYLSRINLRTETNVSIADKLSLIILTSLISFYGYHTLVRNTHWHDDLTFWQQTTRTDPGNSVVWFQLGQAYQVSGQLNPAIEAYNHVISLTPNFPAVYFNLGTIHQFAGQFEQAFEFYNQALKLDPNHQLAQQKIIELCTQKKIDCQIDTSIDTTYQP